MSSILFRKIHSVSSSTIIPASFVRFYSISNNIQSPLTQNEAERIVHSLTETERANLSKALTSASSSSFYQPSLEDIQRPSQQQLRLVLLEATFPFVGFGFLDNAIMIIAGEYIDLTLGLALGISTMAAAAFGNLISDLCGLGLADSVEALCRKLGLPDPELTSSQMKHNSVRWMQRIGRVIGISLGCLLGMAPLYWFNEDTHHEEKQQKN